MKRTLSLSAERLADLSAEELRGVNAASPDYPRTRDCASEYFISVCGCLTTYCE